MRSSEESVSEDRIDFTESKRESFSRTVRSNSKTERPTVNRATNTFVFVCRASPLARASRLVARRSVGLPMNDVGPAAARLSRVARRSRLR